MKKLLTSLLILISLDGISQIEVGSAAGASNKAGIVNINLGYNNRGHHIFYDQIIHLTNASNTPDILGIHYGYLWRGWEPFIGPDYHLLSDIGQNDNARGWHLGWGLQYKFEKLLIKGEASSPLEKPGSLQARNRGEIYYIMIGIHAEL